MSQCDGTNYGYVSHAHLHLHHLHKSMHICTGKSANSCFVSQESSSSNVKVSTNYIDEILILFLQVFYMYYSTEGHHREDTYEPEGTCTHNSSSSSSNGKTAEWRQWKQECQHQHQLLQQLQTSVSRHEGCAGGYK